MHKAVRHSQICIDYTCVSVCLPYLYKKMSVAVTHARMRVVPNMCMRVCCA